MTGYTKDQIDQMKKDDMRYFLHPTSSIADMESWGGPKIIEEGSGIRIKSVEGKTYIDCGSGLWLNNVGFGRTELAEVAKQQMKKLSYFQTFNGYSHPLAIEVAKRVAGMIPMDNPRIFFTSGGSESNDTAYKLARMYWYLQGKPSKNHIIARTKAYHGVSYGAVSATSLPGFWDGFRPLVPGFHHIEHPHCYFCPWGKEQGSCDLECTDALEQKILELGEDNVAAFTAEPVIGTGGAIVPPEGYYQRIREICDRYNVLFIADEVITGFGRTGKMFGMMHWEVKPDIMMMAKGITSGYIPMGAVGISERVFDPIKTHGIFMHGYTYSGHPVACAVALKNIDIVEEENLAVNAHVKGEQLRTGIRDLMLPCIGEVRGIGLMNAVQLVQDSENRTKFKSNIGFAKRVSAIAWENGLALRPLVDDGLQLSPALVITETDVLELVERLGRSIEQAHYEFLGNQL
ncbi:aspartate aminotransferase family protein [Desulfosporosinus sp.]|uniref:aminotransferase family protein n=1 Tax=Desulfosporosinus sp. TaxID=157907 RepID=UPI0025B7C90C|nr:aspartate aminotransferase family protein [Desulfosporosinus sp.]MBC2724031.1 aspartate aminotransferase family protein [Desulfosporosinus sp.]MBC2725934.1 aspartate aminotransferase family protein [Desulfosporosinus sp.]